MSALDADYVPIPERTLLLCARWARKNTFNDSTTLLTIACLCSFSNKAGLSPTA